MNALAIAILILGAAQPEPAAIRRHALIVGMNDGGKQRAGLRYATDDARRMAGVLEELGGVSEFDRTVLLSADRAQLEAAFASLRAQISAARTPNTLRQLIFYYSGHSDGEGLLLGKEHVRYAELRKMIQSVGADIHIAILDSCASGALVRTKGGKPRPPFLVDQSSKVRGHVFLTSSSEDEVAQESDRIGGSFFTHYLISGLRGAADISRDGKVTLSEAYQFAFDETLRRTEQTSAGAQHASYDMQLAGSGDLVTTDLRESAARITIGKELEGRFYLRDASGRLVAELYKARGLPAEIGLEPGLYRVTREHDGALSYAELEVKAGETPELLALSPVEGELAVARGDAPEPPYFPIGVSLLPMLSSGGLEPMSTNFAFDVTWGRWASVEGAQISSLVAQVDGDLDGAQLSGVVGIVGGDLRGVQLSGVLNWADTVEGVQLGVVNVATELKRGVQLGLVNYTDYSGGFRLGLFNVSQSTVIRGAAWSGETDPFEVGLKIQDGSFYTLLTSGTGSFDDEGPWTFGGGFGGQIRLDPFFIDIDATVRSVHHSRKLEAATLLPIRLRIMGGWRIIDRFAIFAGLTTTLAVDFGAEKDVDFYAPRWAPRLSDELALWPGFVAGIEI
jgi:hypothetical protein